MSGKFATNFVFFSPTRAGQQNAIDLLVERVRVLVTDKTTLTAEESQELRNSLLVIFSHGSFEQIRQAAENVRFSATRFTSREHPFRKLLWRINHEVAIQANLYRERAHLNPPNNELRF